MFIDKYVSVFQIIGNVIRDGGYEQTDFIEDDLIQWAAEALDLIGVPTQYIDKVTCLTGYKGKYKLPTDWKQRVQIAGLLNNCSQFPMRESTGTFHPIFKACRHIDNCTCTTNDSYVNFEVPISYDADGNPVINFSNAYNVPFNKNIFVGGKSIFPTDPTYKISDNFIITNFDNPNCKIIAAYKAFPIDDCGYPMIPDNIKYKLAVQWYIINKLDYKMYRKGKITEKVYDESTKQCSWYMGAANEAGHQPSIDQLESWKNQALQLLPKIDRHSTFFERLGQQSQMPFGNRINSQGNYNYYL